MLLEVIDQPLSISLFISPECFPKIGVPQNGLFIMENPINMDDLGGKPTIFGNIHLFLGRIQRIYFIHVYYLITNDHQY